MSAAFDVPYAPAGVSFQGQFMAPGWYGGKGPADDMLPHLESRLQRTALTEARRQLTESGSSMSSSGPTAVASNSYCRLHLKASVGDELSDEDLTQVNRPDADGNCALIWAATNGQADAARTLLENGANPNAQNNHGQTALLIAARAGFEQVCAVLLQFKASPNLADLDGVTPVHMAAAEGHVNVLTLLKLYRADFNARDDNGDTPVHYATRQDQVHAVRYLVSDCGADPAIVNEDMETPLELATSVGSIPPLVEFLHKSCEFSSSSTSGDEKDFDLGHQHQLQQRQDVPVAMLN